MVRDVTNGYDMALLVCGQAKPQAYSSMPSEVGCGARFTTPTPGPTDEELVFASVAHAGRWTIPGHSGARLPCWRHE